MAVTLTRAKVRLSLGRTVGKNTDAEIDEWLSDASSQVAEWVAEAAVNGTSSITFSQHYQDKLAKIQIQLDALSDRMSAQSEVEENFSSVSPQGSQQATERKFYVKNLDRNFRDLKAERDQLLNKLGVSTEVKQKPATPGAVVRGEDDNDLDMTWTNRASSAALTTPTVLKNR